jgi:hypothetical protein
MEWSDHDIEMLFEAADFSKRTDLRERLFDIIAQKKKETDKNGEGNEKEDEG